MTTRSKRAESRATIGQRPMFLGRRIQSAGTECVRLQLSKPARFAPGERALYPMTEGKS